MAQTIEDLFRYLQSPSITIARETFLESETFKNRASQGSVVQVPRDDRKVQSK